jgi:hypothetical protein
MKTGTDQAERSGRTLRAVTTSTLPGDRPLLRVGARNRISGGKGYQATISSDKTVCGARSAHIVFRD